MDCERAVASMQGPLHSVICLIAAIPVGIWYSKLLMKALADLVYMAIIRR